MAATTRRMSAATTAAEKKAAVEAMLREIAYVLHVTRKVSRDIEWPVAAPARRAKPRAAEAAPAVAAV
jgi:hypothetical protein